MRVVLDACVIFPPILRDILLGVAAAGLYQPLWSERIIEEWVRATRKIGPSAEGEARIVAQAMDDQFPRARQRAEPGLEARLLLPDPNDVHVLAVAIGSSADAILTFNASDFPRHVLAEEGVERRDPDGFLWELWSHHPDIVTAVVDRVHTRAETMAGTEVSRKAMLKRGRLSRLAKVV